MPERIQLRRTKGWRKPADAVVVARPSRWGNPFVVHRTGASWFVTYMGRGFGWKPTAADARALAVELFALHIGPHGSIEPDDLDEWVAPLRGRDLACWCPLDSPCHADVLLDLANRPEDTP